MSSCKIQVVKGITVKEITTSVSSYTSSIRYMKKIVPLTVYNIVYNRVNFDENFFKSDSVCNISFKRFKSGTKNHVLADVFYWVKGAVDAIEKKHLKEMHLIFKNNTDDIIMEDYQFNFSYQSEPNPEGLPNSEDVINTTQQLFRCIESLNAYAKMDDDIGISMELMFFDESISENYDPPYFTRPSGIPLFMQMPQKSQYHTIGYLKTGYHKMKCSVKGTTFAVESVSSTGVIDDVNEKLDEIQSVLEEVDDDNTDEPETKRSKSTDVVNSLTNDIEQPISIQSTTNDEADDPDKLIDDIGIHCPCNVNARIGSIKTVKCTICFKYQHLVCVGCTELSSLTQSYICVYCNSKEHQCFDEPLLRVEQSNWAHFCGFRLVLSYCYYYDRIPVQLLQRIEMNTKKEIQKLLKLKKILKVNPDSASYVLNKEPLVAVLMTLFSDFRLPSTMILDDNSETIEIID